MKSKDLEGLREASQASGLNLTDSQLVALLGGDTVPEAQLTGPQLGVIGKYQAELEKLVGGNPSPSMASTCSGVDIHCWGKRPRCCLRLTWPIGLCVKCTM